jgi:intraflagellar transport protein 56
MGGTCQQPKQQAPSLEELLAARDYVGAVTLLRFKRQHDRSAELAEWLAYALFHAGEHDKVSDVLISKQTSPGLTQQHSCRQQPSQRQHTRLVCRTRHAQALAVYQELLLGPDPDPLYHTYAAACCYYLGLTQQAEEEALQVCGLGNRLSTL